MPESVPEDEIREHRIVMEIIVDCYNEEERAMGWYYYLEDQIKFPFQARCLSKRNISPLKYGEVITVIAMGPEEECDHEIFVEVEYLTCYQKTGAEEMLESPEREEIRGEEKAFFGRADHRDFAASRTG